MLVIFGDDLFLSLIVRCLNWYLRFKSLQEYLLSRVAVL
jgi:hypothetical protein